MKLQRILNTMNVKEDQQVWSINFQVKKKTGAGAKVTSKVGENGNKVLAQELNQ